MAFISQHHPYKKSQINHYSVSPEWYEVLSIKIQLAVGFFSSGNNKQGTPFLNTVTSILSW